ncbi:kielin/chordin-like protein isoform X1 [Huso huso]|uniref:Kielin/chordin-like protein isoform X1 n=1 Tax=Huso huso TaxID=61971 RepID=A0ABR0ZTM0_HUSHU
MEMSRLRVTFFRQVFVIIFWNFFLTPGAQLDTHLHDYYDENVIDLLEALNITRSIKGVSKAKGLEPGIPAWKFRQRVPHLTLPRDYSIYFLSTMQGSIGFHFVAQQAKNSDSTLISFISPTAMKKDGHPLLQLVSSTRSNQLRLEYRAVHSMEPATILFPGGTPFSNSKWARIALNLEAHKITLFIDCEESIIFEKNQGEDVLSLILPIDLEITFASMPGNKASKFLGYWQTAEISPSGFLRRPWHCENLSDSLPYSLAEERSVDSQLEAPLITDPSQHVEHQSDFANYQQQQSEPENFPRGPRPHPQAQDELLRRLEEAVDNLSMMLDMVKAQNTDLVARVKYLETCECRRLTCSWEGREYVEGSRWDKDRCTVCLCVKGEVRCSVGGECADPCVSNPCLNGGVCQPLTFDSEQHRSGFRCKCPPTSTGRLCEKPMIQACSLPKMVGHCTSARDPRRRWFYNALSGACEEFTYSGCRGNSNNFESLDACQQRCLLGACCFREPRVPDAQMGFDREGYDRYGYNMSDLDRTGRKRLAVNQDRSGPALFGPNGQVFSGLSDGKRFDKYGFDQQGYGRDGFHRDSGFNLTGYNRNGEFDHRYEFSLEGYNRQGLNRAGFDCSGLDTEGFSYLGPCAGFIYRCEQLLLSDCQQLNKDNHRRDAVSFSPGKQCSDIVCGEGCGCSFNGQTYRFGESFEYGCEVCLCTYTGAVECSCRHLNQRKEVRDMTLKERRLYQQALQSLYSKQGTWEDFAKIRAEYAPQANGQYSFLPWHRYFLKMVERELQKGSSCEIYIPYFEWTIDAGSMETSAIWQANFFGGNGDQQTNCVAYHPFQHENVWSPCLRRRFNTSVILPDVINIQLILAEEDFKQFSLQIETVSGLFHLWVGGHMASPFCPYDPIFLSHYAFMDKLWMHWQERSLDGLPRYPLQLRYVKMKPFEVAPDDVLHSKHQLCTIYVPVTLGAPCNLTTSPTISGFDSEGYSRHGFDSEGYNRDGYNRHGINRRGENDHLGIYDKNGYNKQGYDRSGFDQMGWDQYGYGRDNFDRDNFDAEGYDSSGYNRYGYNRSEVTPFGMRRDGTILPHIRGEVIDQMFENGYDIFGFDKFGLDSSGFDVFGFHINGYDKDSCNYFYHGPHYTRFYFFIQLQITMIGTDILSNIKRICPRITPLPEWWLIQNWMNVDVQETLTMIRHIEQKWASQHPFDSGYIPNISSVQENGLWLPITPDLRFCFELHWFSGCPIGTAPVTCPDLCSNAQCAGYQEAECRVHNCGSCFTEWYDRATGSHVMCQGCSYEGNIYNNEESFNYDECTTCVCLSGDVTCTAVQCNKVTCSNPVKRSGECCPVCLEDCVDGRRNGESWKPDPCSNCTCENGNVQCLGVQCLDLPCLDQYVPPGECCPVCRPGCEYEGEMYDNGVIFLSRTNPCMNCSCLDSLVRCSPVQCQPISCGNPFQKPGQCCPSCPACELDGRPYDHEQPFTTLDGCQKCTCVDGKPSCIDIQQCPHTCTHGVKPPFGPCCRDCSSCDFHGQLIPNGMSFVANGDVCERCLCTNGNVVCSRITCPSLDCTAFEKVPEKCCPKCRGCVHVGIRHEHKSEWKLPDSPCNICRCLEGQVLCENERCNTQCRNPAKPTAGSCCPSCDGCHLNGQDYVNGERVSNGDRCAECTCVNGDIHCNPVACPPVQCRNPVQRPGDCCPRCEECEYDSKTFVDGQSFISAVNPCLSCRCSAGRVSCERLDPNCPPIRCSHPAKQIGQCCPSCEVCEYERRIYTSGRVFTPPGSSPCLQCTCNGGNVRCQEEVCPPVQCSNPVIDPQYCCPICKVCVLNGVEFEDGTDWEPDEDPCSTCVCTNGEPVCRLSPCPRITCLHPTKMNSDCCAVCDRCTYNQRIYNNGQDFIDPDIPCQNCRCQDGTVNCIPTVCSPVTCSRPEMKPGQCCPRCPDCMFENRVFVNGEEFPNPLNPCQRCVCYNGHVNCEDHTCPGATCTYPLPGSCCKNNCNGCNYAGKEYPNGAEFPHPTDKCKDCHCINGNVQCLSKRCPPLLCSNPFLTPGECCPQCPAPPAECLYAGLPYKHMERFYDPSEKCRSCICNNGTITCQRRPCAPILCANPIVQDCCRTCDGCWYGGKELANGEQFADVSDACRLCLCREGTVSCERRTCPAVDCPFPVQAQCCQACEGCNYLGQEYLNGQEFTDPQNQCKRCTCMSGFVNCSPKPCYNPGCTHPISLTGKCCPVCEGCFYNGVVIINGQTFHDPADSCSQCTCRSGSVQCIKRLCSPAPCPHPVVGPCDCPLCDGCYFQGRDYIDGQTFQGSKGGCQECTCFKGEVTCGTKKCSKVSCPHPAIDTCTCPVCDGCIFRGRDCKNGERFLDPNNKCQRCTCLNGGVTCVSVTCPPVSCRNPATPPGECCPQCTGICHYLDRVYETGATFDSPADSCSKCTCINEVVTCHKTSCPQQCSHPVPSPACCPSCDRCFYEGFEFSNRQTFHSPSDPCQRCSCLHGNVVCTTVVCPQTTCNNPLTKPGQCCPECPVCSYFGKEYAVGVHWPSSTNDCQECACVQGEVRCSEVRCDVTCSYPSRLPGQCCPLCQECFFEGVLYSDGEDFTPDNCRQCSCNGGNVNCGNTLCPRLNCMHQVTDPGTCCPRCRGCVYNGREYTDGSSWFATTTPCMSCMCVDGVTTCSEIRCVSPCVNQIHVPGECCPLCADCVYNDRIYGPGDSFQPASDPCEICTCEVMPDGEQHLRCYRKQCPSLVDCPKNHIHFPGSDQCCPTCAQPLSNCTATLVGSEVHATDDPCYTCQCKDLTWICIHQGCLPLNCPTSEQFLSVDSCCPICDECVIEAENRRVSDGESWTDSVDECITCTCNLGHIECHIEECAPVICQDGLVKVKSPGKCCYECQDPDISCMYQGTLYQSNEHWEVDECTTCTCVSGEVHCQTERCPQVSCASDETPALIPGMCCPHCIPRPATCIAFGDPHYRTFDGKMIHFQGACTYVLAEDCEGGDFSIHATNDDRGRKGVSWTKEVSVLIGDVVVQLLQNWVVVVDYQTVTLPFLKEPYIYIERKTNTILLNTNIGVKVLWDGKSHLEVSVPGTYKGHMCGLCGNFNNYPQDDMRIRTGQIVLSEAAFGNSWKVQAENQTNAHCTDGEDIDPCKEAGYRARKEGNAKCKILKSKVFERCHNVVPPEMFFASCVYDLCACGSNGDDCLCDALEAYASECRESGVILQWRSPALCAVGCPQDRGYIFDECGPPCPKTCFNKDVPLGVIEAHCFKPCVPGCQCPAGLVEHESHCIQPEACPKIIYGNI